MDPVQGVPNEEEIILIFSFPGNYIGTDSTPGSFGERARGRSEKDGPCFFQVREASAKTYAYVGTLLTRKREASGLGR